MSGIERADWTEDDPPDTPVPQKSQRISRPDWTDGPPVDVPAPAPVREQAIIRPDWTESEPSMEVSKSEARPDWPIEEPAEAPKYLVIDEIEETPHPAADIVAELAESDGHDLSIAHEAVTAVMDAMPDHAGFESSFDSLPADTRRVILGELALSDRADDADEFSTYASDDELERFASTPEGRELISEWGSSADHRLGVIQARLLRMEDATDMEAAWTWFDALPSAQAKAVLRELASS